MLSASHVTNALLIPSLAQMGNACRSISVAYAYDHSALALEQNPFSAGFPPVRKEGALGNTSLTRGRR